MPDRPHDYEQSLIDERIAKAERLRAAGAEPYPARTSRDIEIAAARAALEAHEAGGPRPAAVTVAGRVSALRDAGRLAFIDIADESGEIQVLASKKALGDDWPLLAQLDLGDFIEASGPVERSRRGEISVMADGIRPLAKALRAPPEKFHGLRDIELRYRRRYLDLIANEDSKRVLRTRSRVVSEVRRFMESRGFMEVETQVLQSTAGGAAARPFETRFNALDESRVLRIALELDLKRLTIGGFDKVFEIGRVFRNEGFGHRWNPEFTMLESYEAYADYGDVAEMVEQMIAHVAEAVHGSLRIAYGGREINLAPPFARITMVDAVREHVGVDFRDYGDDEAMKALLREHSIPIPPDAGWAKLFDALVSAKVEPELQQPTFLLDYPVTISPLAKRTEYDAGLVERFELFVAGWELANSYSELNDPVDQRRRFEQQRRLAEAGDEEAEQIDEDFLIALEHGMPPTGGLGMGMDRLAMLMTDSHSIRDVILFPQMRAQQ